MDVMMPEMDGIEATKVIRASDHPEAKSVIIIAMTANAFEDDVRRTREAGMDGHLSKPIRINEILKTIDQLLASKKISGLPGAVVRPTAGRAPGAPHTYEGGRPCQTKRKSRYQKTKS